nr:zinc finger protein 737-like [Penaeus vannamei]
MVQLSYAVQKFNINRAQREEEEVAPSKLDTNHLDGADAGPGEPSNSVRRSGRQRRPSARHPRPHAAPAPSLVRPAPPSPSSNIPPEELAAKLNFDELVCGCGETLASRTDYVDHVLTHVAGAFRCPQCPCVYTCSSRLARHQRLLHSRGDTPSDALPHGSPAAAPADGVEERCHLCADAVSGGDGDLRNHMRVHLCGEHECPVCALRLDTSYAMEMHVQRKHPSLLHAFLKSEDSLKDESSKSEDSGGLPVRCDVCGKVVATPSRLARHRYLQHPEHYPWPCAACTLAFPSLHARDHHVCPHRRKGGKEASGDGKKNECLVCNTAFKSRVSLECHMRRAHPTEAAGPHACPVCGRSLSSRKALTDHLRCHRREGFACEFCGARLKTLDSLNVHINEIHTHVVRLQCRLCSQVFFSSGRLSYHMKRHHTDRRSYTNLCHLCGKAYPYPSELRLHLRAHRNERPYRCDQCQKTFLKQGDLTYHRRSHTGERPHKCPHCDARFPRPNTLMSHIRQQHRDTAAIAAPTATATTAVNTAATATDAAPSAIAPEAVVTTAAVGPYVSSPPSTVAPPSVSAYLPAGVPVSAPAAVSLQHHRPPTAVTVMGVAGGVGREGGEATLVPVVEGQLVEAVVEGQMTEMQPVQYVQVDGLSAGQTVQTVQAVQAVPHMVEGMEYDEAGSVPYQIVHLQILQ